MVSRLVGLVRLARLGLVGLALWLVSGIALNKYGCEYGTLNSMFAYCRPSIISGHSAIGGMAPSSLNTPLTSPLLIGKQTGLRRRLLLSGLVECLRVERKMFPRTADLRYSDFRNRGQSSCTLTCPWPLQVPQKTPALSAFRPSSCNHEYFGSSIRRRDIVE